MATTVWVQNPANGMVREVSPEKAALLAFSGWPQVPPPGSGSTDPVDDVITRSEMVQYVAENGGGGGGGSTPDATTSVKGKARLLGGTADAPTVPATAITGTLDPARLPPLAIIDYLGAVASQSAMLALAGQKGDWCVRTDTGKGWIITGSDPTQLSSWTILPYPAATMAGLTDLDSTGAAAGSLSALRRKNDGSGYLLESFTPGGGGSIDPGPLEGMSHYAYGHSYTASPAATTGTGPAGVWAGRLSDRKRMTLVSRAVSGSKMIDAARAACGDTATGWTPATRGLVSLICTYNDMDQGGTDPAAVRGYRHAARAFLAAVRSKAKIPAATTAWVFSAGWTKDTTNSPLLTGGRWQTTTVGSYAEVNVTGTAADLLLTLRAAGTGTVQIASDGVTVATVDLTATVAADYTPTAVALTGLGAGTHKIRVTLASGSFLGVDALLVPSEAPPLVLVAGEGAVVDTTKAGQLSGTWLPALAAVVAEFANAVYFTPSGWDPATMIYDGIHPNDRGASKLATDGLAALASLAWSNGLNKIGANVTYTAPVAPSVPSGGQDGTAAAGGGGGGGGTGAAASDTFTRADAAAPGSTETGSLAWTKSGSTWGITSNQLSNQSSADSTCTVNTGGADGTVQLTLPGATLNRGIAVRMSADGAQGYVIWRSSTGTYTITRKNAGYVTLATSSGVTPGSSDVLAVVLSGSTITLKVNGITAATATDSTYATNTRHGAWSFNSGDMFDGFSYTP